MTIVGQQAPEWTATAYVRGEDKTLSSKDFDGKWYVLYWYPADFTFICPTEIREFEELSEDFEDDGVAVIGCSTDSFFSHKQWFEETDTFEGGITHPVLADTNHSVSSAFGVYEEENGIAFRATAIVDPEGRVRSLAVNDIDRDGAGVGRSAREVLRTVQALQSGGLCGAEWTPGEDFVL
jgi:peroxiredoxin (alkyl hydroperoxide reductase subunit C)